jgi:hypothetical protein
MKPVDSSRARKRPAKATARLVFLSLTGFVLLLVSSVHGGPAPPKSEALAPSKTRYGLALIRVPAQGKKQKIKDQGDFKVVYRLGQKSKFKDIQDDLKESKLFEEIAAGLNDTFALPVDLPIVFMECGEENAFYDPDKGEIHMCYELINQFIETFARHSKTPEAAVTATLDAVAFVLFHELGHALIHIYELPATGKEEDAVDQLATLLLIEGVGEEGEVAAIDGARSFSLGENLKGVDANKLAFWDEHSLGPQRFYNILCWVYGQNTEKWAHLVKNGNLPKERAERCSEEYEKMSNAWGTLLDPYFKKN